MSSDATEFVYHTVRAIELDSAIMPSLVISFGSIKTLRYNDDFDEIFRMLEDVSKHNNDVKNDTKFSILLKYSTFDVDVCDEIEDYCNKRNERELLDIPENYIFNVTQLCTKELEQEILDKLNEMADYVKMNCDEVCRIFKNAVMNFSEVERSLLNLDVPFIEYPLIDAMMMLRRISSTVLDGETIWQEYISPALLNSVL